MSKKILRVLLCYPYVISRCGIFNGQTNDLPHHSHTNITTHTPPPISPLSPFLPLSHVRTNSQTYTASVSLTSPPPECSTNNLYICTAS